MKYVHQFLIIMTISFIGELLGLLLPLPIPASVYGLAIMLICLFTRVIKLNQIEEVADWLILIMPVLFVPSAVSLINVGNAIIKDLLVIGIVTLISTIVVMIVTGKVAPVYFGIVISLLSYWIAVQIRKLLPYPIFNPLLISAVISIGILIIFDIDFDTYNKGAQFITFLLTPATVCLAVPLYKQVQILIKHLDAILISLFSGCLAGIVSIFIMCLIMKADPVIYYSLLPKSITTAIAIGVSDKLGGNSTITVGIVIITGILGAIIAKSICKLFKIKHPVAIGLALGNSAHAIGTSKALEFGEIEGAMSSLSIVIAGLLTVIIAPLMANLL